MGFSIKMLTLKQHCDLDCVDIPIFLITKLWFKTVRNEFRIAQPWYVLGMCITVLQKSRTHRRDTHIYKHIHPERFILGIGSYYDCGVQEVSWFTVCMSENRKAGGVIQSETKRSEKQRTDVQGQDKMDVPVQAESKLPSSAFLLCLGPQWMEWYPPILGRFIYFIWFTNPNTNLF